MIPTRVGACGGHENQVLDIPEVGEDLVHERNVSSAAGRIVEKVRVDSQLRDVLQVDVGETEAPHILCAESCVDVD